MADPVNTLGAAINTALVTALDVTVTTRSSAYTTTATDHQKPIYTSGTTTISLGDSAGMGTGYQVTVVNVGSNTVTVALITSSDTLNGTANGTMTVAPGQSVTVETNSTPNGYNVLSNGWALGTAQVTNLNASLLAGLTTTQLTTLTTAQISAVGSAQITNLNANYLQGLTTAQLAALATVNTFAKAQIGTVTALSVSSNLVAVDLSLANDFSLTLQATTGQTLSNPTNAVAGQAGQIVITQNGTPSTLAYGGNWIPFDGTTPTVSTTASAQNLLSYYVADSTHVWFSLLKHGVA